MKSRYEKIGNLVERVDERNHNGSVTTLVGVSIDKRFIKSVANTVGTDLTNYKLIKRNQFAVSLMQVSRDEKIPVARQTDYDVAIMSPAYPIFRVKDENIILPEYLDMWFKRPEFDREATFIAVGGVRGSMPWEDFCRMKIHVPPMGKQQQIVTAYKTITDRIALKQRINDNLEAAALAIYKKIFVENISADNLPQGWKYSLLDEIADVSAGGDRPIVCVDNPSESCNVPIFSNGTENEGLYGYTNKPKIFSESVTVSARGTIGFVCLREKPYVPIVRLISVTPKSENVTAKYLYFVLCVSEMQSTGTSQQQITVPDFKKKSILIPDSKAINAFSDYIEPLFTSINHNKAEIEKLGSLSRLFLSKLSC